MTAVVIVLLVAGVVAVGLLIAWPILTGGEPAPGDGGDGGEDQARRDVEDDLQRSLQAIKEIEFDRAAGHLSAEDFAALDADERARAVDLLRRRDALSPPSAPPPGEPGPP